MRRAFIALALAATAAGASFALSQTAKFEPAQGCLIGAFIQNDPFLQLGLPSVDDLTTFETKTRQHSSYLTYAGYGQPFPLATVKRYTRNGAVMQIGFEPNNGLAEVADTPYLRSWARAAKKSGAMIFLRWASEMNGSWVAWYGSPALYIDKWKLMRRIMREEAPNVAMVWTPNDTPNNVNNPADNPFSYYPGDEQVDWVGVDFYHTFFTDSLWYTVKDWKDPRAKLSVIYDVYAQKKPIMISEWGVAHDTNRGDTTGIFGYASGRIDTLYAHLRAEFPRVKAVTYFDYNTQNIPNAYRDYKITNSPGMLAQYARSVNDPYFLSTMINPLPLPAVGLKDSSVLSASTSIEGTVESPSRVDSVVWMMDEARIEANTSSPYRMLFDIGSIVPGTHTLRAWAYNSAGFSNFDERMLVADPSGNYSNTVIDNADAGFASTGKFRVSASQPDRYGADYMVCATSDTASIALWRPVIPAAGRYRIYAWWSVADNRASNAPFEIIHARGRDTVRVNQKINGGQWNLLGSFQLNAGSANTVTLSNAADAGTYVIADALRFEWILGQTTLVRSSTGGAPGAGSSLGQNYPNPFNPSTTIHFSIGGAGIREYVTLKVFDMLGREIATLIDGMLAPGAYDAVWDARRLPSGMYFCRLTAGTYSSAKSMVMVK